MNWVLNIGEISIVFSWRGRRRSLPSAGTRWRWRDSCSDLWEANWCQFHMISGKDSQCWKRLLGTVAAAAFCERLWCSMLGLSALKYGISTPFHLAHPTDSGWTNWEITEICVLCIEKQQVGGWSLRSQTKLKIQPKIASAHCSRLCKLWRSLFYRVSFCDYDVSQGLSCNLRGYLIFQFPTRTHSPWDQK